MMKFKTNITTIVGLLFDEYINFNIFQQKINDLLLQYTLGFIVN